MLWFIFLLTVFGSCKNSVYNDRFDERLLIKPLPSGHLYAHFEFVVQKELMSDNEIFSGHFRLFPRSLGEVLSLCEVQEVHFSLTQGLWKYEKWGYPTRSAPPGAELWALFKGDSRNVTSNWERLTQVLSGQFCASLNFIAGGNTVTPHFSFRPEGVIPSNVKFDSNFLRHSILPPENFCTENLTPFQKLLPCGAKAGLSTLLNALKVFNAHYVSMAVDVQTVCKNSCSRVFLELTQTVSVVFDPPVHQMGKQDWSFVKLFGMSLSSTCPVATTSKVFVDISSNKTESEFHLNLEPSEIIHENHEKSKVNELEEAKTFAVFDLKDHFKKSNIINIGATYKNVHIYGSVLPPVLYADRKVSGYGQEQGGIHCTFYNNHPKKPLKIVYFDAIPWYLRVYSHTLSIKSGNTVIKPDSLYYQPSQDRKRPSHLEVVLTLPPKSAIEMSVEFELAFLKWTEYPPDANHGFYAGPGVISTVLDTRRNFSAFPSSTVNKQEHSYFLRMHTQILLVSLPTPDFSMPYNVICLTCTVVALAFGPIHNITTKNLHPVDEHEREETFFSKLKAKAKKMWKREDKGAETDDAKKTQ